MNRDCCCTDYKTWYNKTYRRDMCECPDQKYFIAFACPARCKDGKVFKYKKYERSCNEDKCYTKCSKYNRDCQCEECNDRYMRCYNKCKGKEISCNNINVPLDPKKPCLFGTIGVIYPIINQNMYLC